MGSSQAYRAANAAKIAAYGAEWRASNAERQRNLVRQWRAEHPDATGRLWQQWKKNNPGACGERTVRRLAEKLRATPAWADADCIRSIYALTEIYRRNGVDATVDHIVPLRGKTVCGLHVESNLSVLPLVANIRKGNRHWPDMP